VNAYKRCNGAHRPQFYCPFYALTTSSTAEVGFIKILFGLGPDGA